jgi:hypothetical protein
MHLLHCLRPVARLACLFATWPSQNTMYQYKQQQQQPIGGSIFVTFLGLP